MNSNESLICLLYTHCMKILLNTFETMQLFRISVICKEGGCLGTKRKPKNKFVLCPLILIKIILLFVIIFFSINCLTIKCPSCSVTMDVTHTCVTDNKYGYVQMRFILLVYELCLSCIESVSKKVMYEIITLCMNVSLGAFI